MTGIHLVLCGRSRSARLAPEVCLLGESLTSACALQRHMQCQYESKRLTGGHTPLKAKTVRTSFPHPCVRCGSCLPASVLRGCRVRVRALSGDTVTECVSPECEMASLAAPLVPLPMSQSCPRHGGRRPSRCSHHGSGRPHHSEPAWETHCARRERRALGQTSRALPPFSSSHSS